MSETPIDRGTLPTEQPLADSAALDAMSTADAVRLMHAQDRVAVDAVGRCADALTAAVELVWPRLRDGGRMVYLGAGTSGRLGVLDASELPPTFRADPAMVTGVIAGGERAMFVAQEGAEDDAAAGAAAVDDRALGAREGGFVAGLWHGGERAEAADEDEGGAEGLGRASRVVGRVSV
jgi:N-acetylmuramic acid 6-phosphate etherase